MTNPIWTQDDVEAVARATVRDHIPPLEIMVRLGPNPPDDYLKALGRRFMELHQEDCLCETGAECQTTVSQEAGGEG